MISATPKPLRRQSRVSPTRKGVLNLAGQHMEPILEDSEDTIAESSRRNSVKARRRQGVSDLRVPPIGLFSDESGWRISLALDDEQGTLEVLEFPAPPPRDERDSSSSESGSSKASSPATTPAASPTKEAHSLVRCKTIKPLTITKRSRSTSPVPPVPSSPALSSSPGVPQLALQAPDSEPLSPLFDDDDEDDDFYASYARGYFTLTSPIPDTLTPSRSDSTATRRHRESAVIARPMSALMTPPVTPPVKPTHHRSASASSAVDVVPNFSRPTSLAIGAGSPRRTPMEVTCTPARASTRSVWRDSDFALYAPLISMSAAEPSPVASSFMSSPSPVSLAPSPLSHPGKLPPTPLSASYSLLTPISASSRRFPPSEVPSDIEVDGDWEDAFDATADYPDLPSDVPVDCYDEEEEELESRGRWTFPPSPLVRREPVFLATPVSPCSVFSFPSDSQDDSDIEHEEESEVFEEQQHQDKPRVPPSPLYAEPATPASPILRSRWSASTLASVRTPTSASASPRSAGFRASGKTFAFARRYLRSPPTPSSSASDSSSPAPKRRKPKKAKKTRPMPVPMGSVSSISRDRERESSLLVGRPPAPMSVLAAAAAGSGPGAGEASPFAAAWPFSAQWTGSAAMGAGRYC